MRMRRKPWAGPELAACRFFVNDPQEHRGAWNQWFARKQPIHMELGCGKGSFMAQLSVEHPELNYLVLDIKNEVLVLAKRAIERAYEQKELPVDNVALMSHDIERISLMMAPEDRVERIYINFCNPWPKSKHKKRRLTYPRQLEQYKAFLAPGGELHFKTDDDGLFDDTLIYLKESGIPVTYLTRDLHNSGYQPNLMTEHELMFSNQGIPIKFLIAKLPDTSK